MIDVHSHILFNVDDGSKSIKESIELLKRMSLVGFKYVYLTPHFIFGSNYDNVSNDVNSKFNELKNRLIEEKIDINIILGNEIYFDNKLLDNIKLVNKINDSFLLIELPLRDRINDLYRFISNISDMGYNIILAHPERYSVIQMDYSLLNKLKNSGVYFQVNYGSIIGEYGNRARKLVKYMYKNNFVDYLGTDLHSLDRTVVLDKFYKINKKIKRYSKDNYDRIIDNMDNLI